MSHCLHVQFSLTGWIFSWICTSFQQLVLNPPALALSELSVKTQVNVSSWDWTRHSTISEISNHLMRNEHLLLWTRPWDSGSRRQPHTKMTMQLVTGRPGRRIAWRIPGFLHFILRFGYRVKVLFPAIWLAVGVLSWCFFFGIAFVSLPFISKNATCSHGPYDHQWHQQSPVASEDLTILCC